MAKKLIMGCCGCPECLLLQGPEFELDSGGEEPVNTEEPSTRFSDLASKLWDLGNLIAGFAVAQSIAFGYVTLHEQWLKKVQAPQGLFVLAVVTALIIFVSAAEMYAIWWCHRKALALLRPGPELATVFRGTLWGRLACVVISGPVVCMLAAWGPLIDQMVANQTRRQTGFQMPPRASEA